MTKPDRPVDFQLAASEGDRAAFTEDEVRRALVVLGIPADWLDRTVRYLYDMDPAGGIIFDEMLLSALGSLSEASAARVVDWLKESPADTAARVERFENGLRERGLR